MSTLAIVHPTGLLGKELRRYLELHRDQWRELRLLTTRDEDVGVLTEVRGSAAVVQRFEIGSLDRVDVAFLIGDDACDPAVLEGLPAEATAVLLGGTRSLPDAAPVVAGVNLDAAYRGGRLISPHPAVVALTRLLDPLLTHQPMQVVATLMQSASEVSSEAIDEVLDQSRSILAFQTDPPTAVFGTQIAYNLLPATAPATEIGRHVRQVLGTDLQVAVQAVQAGAFHGLGLSLYVRLLDDPGVGAVRGLLAEQDAIELVDEAETLGLTRAAGRDELLVGDIREADDDGGYWLWAVLDNLTLGGAGNAIRVFDAIHRQVTH